MFGETRLRNSIRPLNFSKVKYQQFLLGQIVGCRLSVTKFRFGCSGCYINSEQVYKSKSKTPK